MTPEEQKLLLLQGGKAIKNQEDTNKILKELSNKKTPAPVVSIHPEIKIPEIKIPEFKQPVIEFPVVLNVPPVSIPDNLLDGLRDELRVVVSTLRTELSKLDKDIKFPDNKDLIEALSKIENKIQVAEKLEIADYTEQLKGITENIEKIQPTDLSKLEVLLKNISETLNKEPEKSKVFDEVSSKNPLPIMVIGGDGKRVTNFGGELTAPSIVGLRVGTTVVDSTNPLPVTTDGFAIPMFDTQIIDESAAPTTTTITYKLSGVAVATKIITVSGTTTTISVTLA